MLIDPELKCILYECLQAEAKTHKMDEEKYQIEIAGHIEREARKAKMEDGMEEEDDLDLVNEFKELVSKQKEIDAEND